MKNLFKKSSEIELNFIDWVFKQSKGWKHAIVNFCLYFEWFSNIGKFQPGDLVRYNWFAHVVIKSVIKDKTYKFLKYNSSSYCSFIASDGQEDSCDAFWLRKKYFWEK